LNGGDYPDCVDRNVVSFSLAVYYAFASVVYSFGYLLSGGITLPNLEN